MVKNAIALLSIEMNKIFRSVQDNARKKQTRKDRSLIGIFGYCDEKPRELPHFFKLSLVHLADRVA